MPTITYIDDEAFEGSGLTDIDIPISVTYIGTRAFADCTDCTSVTLARFATNSSNPSYTALGLDCFSGTFAINPQNYACLTTMYINGYDELYLRSGTFENSTYTGAGFDNDAVTSAIAASCFNEGTKILCFNSETNEEYYAPIQNLKKGDLVKTYLHGYRKVDVLCKGKLRNNTKHFTICMYKMSKTETNSVMEDLIIIGGHSILVDELSEEEYLTTCSIWGTTLKIDEKYLLIAGISDKFEKMEGNDVYTYYHFCVENDGNDETRYGIWANGVLVETPCKKDILGFPNVLYI